MKCRVSPVPRWQKHRPPKAKTHRFILLSALRSCGMSPTIKAGRAYEVALVSLDKPLHGFRQLAILIGAELAQLVVETITRTGLLSGLPRRHFRWCLRDGRNSPRGALGSHDGGRSPTGLPANPSSIFSGQPAFQDEKR
jgi:hypothetical protein